MLYEIVALTITMGFGAWNLYSGQKRQALAWALLLLGGLSNATVMRLNQGRMPVLPPHNSVSKWDARHGEATRSSRWLALADRFGPRWARFSLGDVVIVVGLALLWPRSGKYKRVGF